MRDFHKLVDAAIGFSQEGAWQLLPELVLCVTVLCLLIARLFSSDRLLPTFCIALGGSVVALVKCGEQLLALLATPLESVEFFGGMLAYDAFGTSIRSMLCLFLVLVVSLTVLTGVPDREDAPDFYTLLFGATLGMLILAQAKNLLMVFVGIEMASVPSYALVGFIKGGRRSSEAALKYVVYGAGASGTMLFGISLLMGILGTGDFTLLGSQLARVVGDTQFVEVGVSGGVLLGLVLILCGFAFKLSIVPFHFWCPDAFEGATAEVAAFLSVASKAAAFAGLIRLVTSLCSSESSVLSEALTHVGLAIGVVAGVTITFGNLAAYSQVEMKRLLAYSTIAHAGYMLLAVSCLMVCLSGGRHVEGFDFRYTAVAAIEGILFYLFCYLFMNLGAFSIVAIIRNHVSGERIDDFNGVGWEAPAVCCSMCVCIFSLVGLPPLGGFIGKFEIFAAVFSTAEVHWLMYVLLSVAGINSAISLVYYIRILRAMFMRPRPLDAVKVEVIPAIANYSVLIALPVVLLGLFPNWTTSLAARIAESMVRQ